MFARCTDQMARLGTRWRTGKMQKRLQRSHTHLISSAFSTQLELGILDPMSVVQNGGDQRQTKTKVEAAGMRVTV